jgi:hypothetical protein
MKDVHTAGTRRFAELDRCIEGDSGPPTEKILDTPVIDRTL